MRRARQALVGVEHRPDALQADRSLRDVRACAREVLDRPEQLAEIRQEDDQRAGGHRPFQHEPRAEPEHRCGSQGDQPRHHRPEQRSHAPRVERRLDALDALRVQPLPLERALRERLDDADGAEALLDNRHDFALPAPHVAGRLPDDGAEPEDEEGQQRRHRQRHEREAPVQRQHHGEHPADHQHVNQDVEQRGRRELLHGVDVVRDRADERSHLLLVVVQTWTAAGGAHRRCGAGRARSTGRC